MDDRPPEPEDKEAERRFNETLGRLVNTPPKPHKESVAVTKKSGAKGRKAS
jgi:hypothetical protein